MRVLSAILLGLLVLIQYPLWLGKGGWLRVGDLDRKLALQRVSNDVLQQRNDGLTAEVRDLKNGNEAIEERARYELGLIKNNEIFFQFIDPPATASR